MHMKFVPLGLIASILVSSVSARSIYAENSLVARCESGCSDGSGGHEAGNWSGDDSGRHGNLIGVSNNEVVLEDTLSNILNGLDVENVANNGDVKVLGGDGAGIGGSHHRGIGGAESVPCDDELAKRNIISISDNNVSADKTLSDIANNLNIHNVLNSPNAKVLKRDTFAVKGF